MSSAMMVLESSCMDSFGIKRYKCTSCIVLGSDHCWVSQVVLVVKNRLSVVHTRDLGLIPGSGRSPGGGHDNPF